MISASGILAELKTSACMEEHTHKQNLKATCALGSVQ